MNKTLLFSSFLMGMMFAACSDQWDEHYGQASLTTNGSVTLYKGDIAAYVQSQPDLSIENTLLDSVYKVMEPGHNYTLIVYPDDLLGQSEYGNQKSYATYCISDAAIAPDELADGLGIDTWSGKNIWVYKRNGTFTIDEYPIEKVVKADNGYIYHISEGVVPIRPSVYDVLKQLPDATYSKFKNLVKQYERTYFDPSKCTVEGTNAMGNTIYSDSAKGWTVKNILMDRYTAEGVDFWNMRSEDFVTTMLIPSNEVIAAAVDTALARVPLYLRRKVTAADRAKFEKWVVRACFLNQRITAEQISGNTDMDCVAGYQKDTLEGTTYTAADAAMWRPTVQKVRTADAIACSNGTAYFVDFLKIPNNVIIYRLKSRFYELWNNMTTEERTTYFRWSHWIDPMVLNDAQGSFQLSETLPTMYYHVLTAIPDKEARRDSLVCSVTYDGVLFNENNDRNTRIQPCHIPAGEYYLRMGFKHSLLYSLSIQFNETLLIKDMVMYAQGSNYHFDRGTASVMEYNGSATIGYPEGYNWHDWSALSEKAQAYDTDGYQVGIVNVTEEGNFTITISSTDMSYLYDYNAERNTSNVKQLMMYHWCLRPTKNNY